MIGVAAGAGGMAGGAGMQGGALGAGGGASKLDGMGGGGGASGPKGGIPYNPQGEMASVYANVSIPRPNSGARVDAGFYGHMSVAKARKGKNVTIIGTGC